MKLSDRIKLTLALEGTMKDLISGELKLNETVYSSAFLELLRLSEDCSIPSEPMSVSEWVDLLSEQLDQQGKEI